MRPSRPRSHRRRPDTRPYTSPRWQAAAVTFLEVTLLWDPRSNEVSVEVVDQLEDSGFCLPIAGHLALDAFHHPYAYAQSHENHRDRIPQTT